MFEFVLYYVEHLIILPIGPIVLYRRYGFPKPSLKNHLCGYGTFIAFHMLLLVPISRFLKVNLNFALCHSPDEPFYPNFGYNYVLLEIFNVCAIAFLVRFATYFYVKGFFQMGKFVGMKIKSE
jgi:hypothetical protein